MNSQAISNADPVIAVHIICGLCALVVGPIALYSNARHALHRPAGYLWVFSMILLAGTSFSSKAWRPLDALARFICGQS